MSESPTAAEIAKVRRAYFAGERLTAMPRPGRKRQIALEQIVQIFEPGRRYPEVEVNVMLRAIWDDVAAVRRYLVESALLDRAGGEYWRIGGPVDV